MAGSHGTKQQAPPREYCVELPTDLSAKAEVYTHQPRKYCKHTVRAHPYAYPPAIAPLVGCVIVVLRSAGLFLVGLAHDVANRC